MLELGLGSGLGIGSGSGLGLMIMLERRMGAGSSSLDGHEYRDEGSHEDQQAHCGRTTIRRCSIGSRAGWSVRVKSARMAAVRVRVKVRVMVSATAQLW